MWRMYDQDRKPKLGDIVTLYEWHTCQLQDGKQVEVSERQTRLFGKLATLTRVGGCSQTVGVQINDFGHEIKEWWPDDQIVYWENKEGE